MGQPQNGQESQRGLTSLKDMASVSGGDVFWLEGGSVYHNGNVIKMNYTVTSLDRLVAGDKLAVKRQIADGSLRFLVNDEDCGKMISLKHINSDFFRVRVIDYSILSYYLNFFNAKCKLKIDK